MDNQIKKRLKGYVLRYSIWLKVGIPSLLFAVFFFALSISNVYTKTYHLDKFSTAGETIRSPITVENKRKTELEIRKATQAVEERYTVSTSISEERLGKIEEIFDAVREVRDSGSPQLSNEEISVKLRNLLSDDIIEDLPLGVFQPFLEANKQDLAAAEDLLISSLQSSFDEGIKSTDLTHAEDNLQLKVQYSQLPNAMKQSVSDLGNFALVENALFDPQKTNEARKKAASQVEPVIIRAGEVLVTEGATITNDVYEELQLTGLLDQQRNGLPLLGLGVFSLLLGAIIFYECLRLISKEQLHVRHLAVILLISIFMAAIMKIVSLYTTINQPIYYALPAATGTMLLKLLCNERIALVLSIVYTLMACLLFNGETAGMLNANAGIYIALSQLAGAYFLVNTKDRLSIVKSSTGVAVVNILSVVFFIFISFEKYAWLDVVLYSGYGVIAAYLAAVLTIGLLPFIEAGFGILSDSKLLVLSNPNHPLLRKILIETPGTYHHSVMVANLSESACEAVGANGLLARVAAYYHDLGKTEHPHYFIENQMGMKNPHDFLEPEQSAEIIINHPYDGARLLEKEGLPKEIVAVAREHHGTTLLKYFYHKAKEKGKEVSEEDFRYPGPKPQSKEAAIVSICDSVEAAVRSLNHPTEEKIRSIVHSIIENRLLDEQFDNCRLTFKELKIIENSICETLQGIFHSRIQYPNTDRLVKEAK
ncbi:HD family phosphohydrolase [Halobacillus salinarum]|uniref:HD family phosphohydrolase n=1 Tax=Halobacillus salinarum TaxID=2932257 RepID=A0ABY4EPQ1_9BACI|nr:HD family phosphohydrolase [Halobacillus salinarum]UOQ46350.1 HD family phosphohydrolase [Halobacillus salinarum]